MADAQSQANIDAIRESAKVNAVNQYGPGGSTTYQYDENGVPISQTVSLDGAGQQNYDTTMALRNALANAGLGQASSLSSDPFTNPSGNRDAVEKALYDRKLGLLQPQFAADDKALELRLSERGIPIGSEIYKDEMNRSQSNRDNALLSAAQDATIAGGQEASRGLSDALATQNQNYAQIAQLLSGGMGTNVSSPQFQNTPAYQVAPPDISGLISNDYAQRLNAYNQNQSSLASGLFGLGSAAIGLSDRRLKIDIRRIGKLDNGLPIYGFRYIDGVGPYQFGVMADEVEDAMPEAVVRTRDGIRLVNYETVALAINPKTEPVAVGVMR